MSVSLKSIPGVMLEKNVPSIYATDFIKNYAENFNEAITQQGEVKITHNRDKLINLMFLEGDLRSGENVNDFFARLADAIITGESKLLERAE